MSEIASIMWEKQIDTHANDLLVSVHTVLHVLNAMVYLCRFENPFAISTLISFDFILY